jgi:DNA-binding CsgD family transcriptional regulator
MDITRLSIWVCFFFCLALSSGGILIFFQKKGNKEISASSYLQYFLILVYTFGFYSMWSTVLFRILFQENQNIAQLPAYLALIGTPFLVAGMFMLVLWAVNLLKQKPQSLFVPLVSLIAFLILLVYITYKRFDLLLNIRQIYSLFVILITFFTGVLLCFSELRYIKRRTKIILTFLVFLSGGIHIPLFLNSINDPVSELVFIFLFFFINTAIGIYFVYNIQIEPVEQEEDISDTSFDLFIREFGITSRESQIIQEIYKGKTNQEIADKLFVTVQTIKDHTHRIYMKTNIKNRAQLTSFLRRYETIKIHTL